MLQKWNQLFVTGLVCVVGMLCTVRAQDAAESKKKADPKPAKEPEEVTRKKEHASLAAYPNAVIKAEDKESGIAVEVDENGKDLTAKKADKVVWNVTLAKGNEIGTPVIRNVTIADGKVSTVIGKHRYVTLDLQTGKTLKDESD